MLEVFHRFTVVLKKLLKNILLLAIVAAVVAGMVFWRDHRHSSGPPNQVVPVFDKHQYSTDEVSSLWAVVDKGRVLPSNYVPAELVVPSVKLANSPDANDSHLRQDAAHALEAMFAGAASQKGYSLVLFSGYRSYNEQSTINSNFAATQGQADTDQSSARPGHSEHQTGLAADISTTSHNCELELCFGDTAEGKWLAANAYKYGFILRYQKSQENLTGYEYEPWHFRYVGLGLAEQIHQTNQTLEQFFGLPVYTNYPANPFQLKS